MAWKPECNRFQASGLVHLQLRHISFKMQLTMLTELSQHTIVFNSSRLKGRPSGIGVKACSSALML
jgi:hypothetical protein